MKKILLTILPVLAAFTLQAQTLHDNTWYSIYDDATHTMNTQGDYETGGVFAPTADTLNVKWRYEWLELFGIARKIDTDVLESSDGGNSTNQVGSFQENTDNKSNTTEQYTISRNINWIKFNRSGLPTHKVHVYHIDIPLAQHILLASSEYGTTEASYDFDTIEILHTSEAYNVQLRSFLSAGDITISSSNPEVFHVGAADSNEPVVFAVGANACASANGTAATASATQLGNISNYSFPVYFTPQEAKAYEAVITITDGVSTATVTVKGEGQKHAQSIVWAQEATNLLVTDTILTASATSGLPITYTIEPENIVVYADSLFVIKSQGAVTITAIQEGDDRYLAAEPVTKTFTISRVATEVLAAPEASAISVGHSLGESVLIGGEATCAGTFAWLYPDTMPELGEHTYPVIFTPADTVIYAPSLTEATVQVVKERLVQTITWEQEIPEIYVSYSIGLTATASSGLEITYLSSDSTIAYVDSLNQLVTVAVGEVVITATQEGNSAYYAADSVAKTVIVVPIPTTYGEYAASFCQGDSVEFAGVWHHSATEQEVLMEEKNSYGGDSIVRLSITVDPVYAITDSLSFMTGQSVEWQSIVLDSFPIGDTTLVAAYSSIHGCDSVYTLYLTVRPRIVTYGSDTVLLCAGDTYEYEGHTYKHATVDSVRLSRPNSYGGDSIVILVVQVLPSMRITSSQTIYEGDTVTWQDIDLSVIPAGDTTLTVIYSSVYGCDSTFVLQLTVVEKETGIDPIDVNAGKVEKFFRNGEMYIRKNGQVYNLQGIKVKEE